MPYSINRYKTGFRVCKADDPTVCFSKKPLSKRRATKQRIAIILNEGSGRAERALIKHLRDLRRDPEVYLAFAQAGAAESGYNPAELEFSPAPRKKLRYRGVDFGAAGYGDYIIYNLRPDLADPEAKRAQYIARAGPLAARSAPESAAALSYNILW